MTDYNMEGVGSFVPMESPVVRVAQMLLMHEIQQTYADVVSAQSPAVPPISVEEIVRFFDDGDMFDTPPPSITFGRAVPYQPPFSITVHFGRTEPLNGTHPATGVQGHLGGGQMASPHPPPALNPQHAIPDNEAEIGITVEVNFIFLSILSH